jgi:hypothetical protein
MKRRCSHWHQKYLPSLVNHRLLFGSFRVDRTPSKAEQHSLNIVVMLMNYKQVNIQINVPITNTC